MTIVDAIDALLPQTQCTKCGFAGCRPYAQAIATGEAPINRCPPAGAEGIGRLARLLGRDEVALDPAHGQEQPRRVAWIDPAQCIGCTRCIQACPVDAIIGAPRRMHTVIAAQCTGCDLCAAPCPVDCIAVTQAEPALPWRDDDARAARARHDARRERLARRRAEHGPRPAQRAASRLAAGDDAPGTADAAAAERKRAIIEAALRRARERALALPARQPRAAGANDGPAGDSGDCA